MVAAKAKRNKQTIHKQNSNQSPPHDWLHQIAFWGLALLLFFPPYFRGLFFAPQQEKALILAALVFWVTFIWRWLQRDNKFLATPLDWFALALPLVYILSTFGAVNKGLAIQEVVKNILYFLTFWSVARLVRHEKDAENILKVIYISAIGVALAGLATATGIIEIKDGMAGQNDRIASTFQYPNALAAYLGAVVFMGAYLWNRALDNHREELKTAGKRFWNKLDLMNLWGYLLSCGNYLLLAVLIGTKSRGGLLVFALVFMIYLIGMGVKKGLLSALHLGYLGAIAYITMNKFIPLAKEEQMGQAWTWILGGLALAAAGQVAFKLLDQHIFAGLRADGKKATLAFVALTLILVIAAGLWLSNNQEIIEKVKTDRSAHNRIYMIETAADMVKDSPLLGWGGGGWREAYQSYMDYRITSRETHSYYLQLGVETGILGLLAVAGIWISFLYLAHRMYHGSRDNPSRRHLTWTLTIAFLMIAGHATIDFDLSLSALTLVLWSTFGIIAGLSRGGQTSDEGQARTGLAIPRWVPPAAGSTLILVILLGTFSLAQARSLMTQGVNIVKSNHVNPGLQYMERAVSYNPFNAGYHLTLSQLYISLKEEDKAVKQAQRAIALSQYDTNPRNNLTRIAISAGDYELAARTAAKTVELAPNERSIYENLARTYNRLGVLELEEGNEEKALDYFDHALLVPEQMTQYWESIDEANKGMWSGTKLQMSRPLLLSKGEAHYWLGDFAAAERSLQEAAKNKDLKAEARMYQALIKERQGKQQKAKELLKEAIDTSPGVEERYENLKRLPVL
ncbi:MAG: tetratricopeptide repeat protein [Firmicutes bacterium]|nr:tetratricopeptide repeat protein [Bacillota bacterium]